MISPPMNVTETMKQLNEKTQLEGEKWFREKRKVSFFQILVRSKIAFLKAYLLQANIVKGFFGFMQSVNESLYLILSYAKYWELTERERVRM